jgi:hypothetical protein
MMEINEENREQYTDMDTEDGRRMQDRSTILH